MAPKKKAQKPELPETDGETSHVVALRLEASFQLCSGLCGDDATGQCALPGEDKEAQQPIIQVEYTPLSQSESVRLVADTSPGTLRSQLSHVAHAVITEELLRSRAPAVQVPLQVCLLRPGVQSDGEQVPVASAELSMDIADLLLGATECTQEWSLSSMHLPVPEALTQYMSSAHVTVHCCQYIEPGDVDCPLEAKDPHPFVPPVLLTNLAPLVLQFPRALDLPDMPATPESLDSSCYRCCLRFRLPCQEDWHTVLAVNVGGWSGQQGPPDASDLCDPPLRKRALAFLHSVVIFTYDLDIPKFMDACLSEALVVEVHDRDAKPVELKIPMPKEIFPEPPPLPDPVQEAPAQTAKGGKKGKANSKPAVPPPEPEAEAEAQEPAEPEVAPLDGEYVCGRVHLRLAPLSRGLTAMHFDEPILPHTTVRSTAGLDWRQRPGVYLHADSRLQASIRCATALPEMAPDRRPQPFSRALFVMGHADSEMFHVVEDCVRLQNAKALGLIPEAEPEADPEHVSTASRGAAAALGDT